MARSKKNQTAIDLSRRSFLRRASLLVGSLSLGAGAQTGLMDAITRKAFKTYGTAVAQPNEIVDFSIEICFRLGFQTNCLFPSPSHKLPVGQRLGPDKLNFYYDAGNVEEISAGDRNLYLARTNGSGFGANPLAAHATDIATSESVMLTNSHDSIWDTRSPNGAPCPSVMHARHAPADVPVRGIVWGDLPMNSSGVEHPNGDLPQLQAVTPREKDFVAQFGELPLPFTHDELALVVGQFDAAGQLVDARTQHQLDQIFRNTTRLKRVDGPAELLNTGRGLSALKTDLKVTNPDGWYPEGQVASLGELATQFGYDMPALSKGGVHFGKAMMQLYRAMALGLVRTATLNVQSQDWHGFIPTLDDPNSEQAEWAGILSQSLATFLDFAQATTNPFNPDKKIADSLLISLSSEFTRTPCNQNGSNNQDGGSQAFTFLGTHVNGGSYGDVDSVTAGGSITGEERIRPFDPDTGTLLAAGRTGISPGSVWKTHMALMGIPESAYSGYGVDGSIAPILLK